MLGIGQRKELKELRNDAQELVDLHKEAVGRGDMTSEEAEEQLRDTLGENYREDLEAVEEQLQHDFAQKARMAAGLMIGVIITVLLASSGITGFLVVDTPNTIRIEQAFTESTTFIPGISENISALRATGEYTGSGDVRIIHMDSSGTERVVYENFAPQVDNSTIVLSAGSVGSSTNRTVSFDSSCEETCNMNASGPHVVKIEVSDGTLDLDTITYSMRREINESQEPSENETSTPQEPVHNETVVPENQTEPINETPQVNETQPVNQTLQNVTQPTNETNSTQPEIPDTNETELVNETPQNQTQEPEETEPVVSEPEETPDNQTQEPVENETSTPQDTSLSLGVACTQNSQCTSGLCKTSRYQGVSASHCASSNTQCVSENGVSNPGETVNGNTCYSNSEDALWIADEGRFEVTSLTGALMYADKYGNAAITGDVYEEQTTRSSGWSNPSESIILEQSTGDLYLQGILQQETNPQGSGKVIQDANLITQIVFRTTGDLMLRGQILQNANLS